MAWKPRTTGLTFAKGARLRADADVVYGDTDLLERTRTWQEARVEPERLDRQIRGALRRAQAHRPISDDDALADAYFATRGRDSQLGAWASEQSRPLDTRDTFERRFAEAQARFEGGDVPRPPHWGGYRIAPDRIELWQDREHRLHERRLFLRDGEGWTEGLLFP